MHKGLWCILKDISIRRNGHCMKHSHFLTILAVLLIIASTTAIASAEDNEGPAYFPLQPASLREMRGGTTTKTEDRKAEFKENIKARQTEFQSRMTEFRKEKITHMITLMKRRFMAAIERLRNIADRLDARIEKIEDETGKDLSEAQGYVDDARTHIDTAEDIINDVSTSTASSLFENATTSGNRFGTLRTLFAEAKEELKTARSLLGKALRAIGQSHGKEKPATTTSSN
jgi:hypothetical protein